MIWSVPTRDGTVTVREQIEPEDERAVLDLFASCADYFEAATGGPSAPGDVQSLFYALPEGASPDDKRLFLVLDGEHVIGLVDAVVGYPDARSVAVGLFLVHPGHRRRGVGAAVARHLMAHAADGGVDRVTATVAEELEPGESFLRSLDFEIAPRPAPPTGNRVVHRAERPVLRASRSLR